MDAPIWSNDLLYVRELLIIMTISAVMIGVCFYFSKRNDRKRALRTAHAITSQAGDRKSEQPVSQSHQREKP
jgi:Flp pilus assembly protein TadB